MRFKSIFLAVVAFTAMSAASAIALGVAAAVFGLHGLDSLVAMFSESFKLGLAAILGMLGASRAVK